MPVSEPLTGVAGRVILGERRGAWGVSRAPGSDGGVQASRSHQEPWCQCALPRRDLHTFTVLPRRWVVERTLAWITSYRRCARDYERLPAHHEAMIHWAMITIMTRRLTRPG